jgi:hypothetical protein
MKTLAPILCYIILLAACTVDVEPVFTAELSHSLPGPGVQTTPLTLAQCQSLAKWLNLHTDGWTPSPASYVPSLAVTLHHADSSTTTLMILDTSVVMSKGSDQYTRNVEADQLATLRTLLVAP